MRGYLGERDRREEERIGLVIKTFNSQTWCLSLSQCCYGMMHKFEYYVAMVGCLSPSLTMHYWILWARIQVLYFKTSLQTYTPFDTLLLGFYRDRAFHTNSSLACMLISPRFIFFKKQAQAKFLGPYDNQAKLAQEHRVCSVYSSRIFSKISTSRFLKQLVNWARTLNYSSRL